MIARKFFGLLALCMIAFASGCGSKDGGDPKPTDDFKVKVYSPVKVEKTAAPKVFVHMMPWFESKTSSSNGNWGQHWTMANKNPDVIIDAATGRRQIASHFYPLIGPYASSDQDVIEYQLLLMKLSGIDGIMIDWYGTANAYDYPANLRNSDDIIALVSKVGLEYAIVYEDQAIKNASSGGFISDKIAAAKNDMNYMSAHYFSSNSYSKIDGKPMLLDFGPQTFQSSSDWTDIFSVLGANKPKFFTLWNESGEAGANAAGEYAWVYQNDQPHTTFLDNFYSKDFTGIKIGSAYPGFKDFYQQGGWGANLFYINHAAGETFNQTLDKALDAGVSYIQLVTWNDYGEGTMIEPTQEFQYYFLNQLQTKLGTTLTQHELDLVVKLYTLRKSYAGDAAKQKRLNQVFYYLVALKFTEAEDLLNEID